MRHPHVKWSKRVLVLLLLPTLLNAKPFPWKQVTKVLEHVSIGASTEIAVSQVAGGSQKWPAGLVAAGLVAGFKEGADVVAGRDTKKQAAIHALTILAGAGVAAGIKH